jgi:hypothetical protein
MFEVTCGLGAATGGARRHLGQGLFEDGLDHYGIAMRDPKGNEFDINLRSLARRSRRAVRMRYPPDWAAAPMSRVIVLMAPNCHSARGGSMVLDEATLVAVTSAPPPECGRCQRAERRFRRGIPRSSFDELLAAVDVEGRAGDRGVRHKVDGQCGDVGRADDAADRQRGTELRSALVDLVAEQ